MKIREVERFFRELDKRLHFPIQIILTGGAAATLFGAGRVTMDIDFEVKVKSPYWSQLVEALKGASSATGITPQFSEDIDRWNSIILPSKKSRLYRKIGKIEVRLLDPGLWAIGKLTRFLPTDIRDLHLVLKKLNPNPESLARLWGQALGASPRSSTQDQFRRQVELFFDQYASLIWGKKARPEKLKKTFLSTARRSRHPN